MRDKLDMLLRHFQANKSVVFAFDGPAPFAKLEVQRSRREVDITRAEISPGTSYSRKLQSCLCSNISKLSRTLFNDSIYSYVYRCVCSCREVYKRKDLRRQSAVNSGDVHVDELISR